MPAAWRRVCVLAICLLVSPLPLRAAWTAAPSTTPAANQLDTVPLWAASDGSGSAATPGLVDGAIADLAVGAGGDVYGVGFREEQAIAGNAGPAVLVLTRHTPQGALVWESPPFDTASTPWGGGRLDKDAGLAVAVTSDRVYAMARILPDPVSGPATASLLLVEYNLSGGLVCSGTYDSGADDLPVALAADASGAYLLTTTGVGTGGAQDVALVAFGKAGCTLAWSRPYPAVAGDTGDDEAVAMVMDAGASRLYVLGTRDLASNASRHFVLVYDTAGNRLATVVAGSGDERATMLGLDRAHGRLYVGSERAQQGGHDAVITAYGTTPAGATLPAAGVGDVQAIGGYANRPVAIAIDPGTAGSGRPRLFVAIESADAATNRDLALVKYDLDLVPQWPAPVVYDSGGDDVPVAVVVDDTDPADEVYVALTRGAYGGRDMVLLHYETLSGNGSLQDTYVQDFAGSDDRTFALARSFEGTPAQLTLYLAGGSRSNSHSGTPNGRLSLLKYGHARPDLRVQVANVPATAINEGTIRVDLQTENVQDALTGRLLASGPFSVTFYLAPDAATASLCPAGCQAFSAGGSHRLAGGLASGAVENAAIDLVLPPSSVLAPGSYRLVAIADQANEVIEQDETNNRWISGTSISVADPPDLTATAVGLGAASLTAGASVTASYTLRNLRAVPVANGTNFVQTFFLRPVGAVDASTDIALTGDAVVGQFPANGNQVLSAPGITVPPSTPPGSYHVGVVVDATGLVTEVDETNNRFVDATATLQVLAIPDLTVAAVTAPRGAVAGATAIVTSTVAVTGSDVGRPFTVSFYLSVDSTVTTADTWIGCRSIPAMTVGTPDTAQTTVQIPSALSGVRYVGAIVDSGDPACGGSSSTTVLESDEGNNGAAAAETTSIGLPAGTAGAKPDLYLASVTAPAGVTRGAPFTVTADLRNVLPEAAGSFLVKAYVSPDPLVTTADVEIGSLSVAGLAGNSSNPALAITATIPTPVTRFVTWDPAVSCQIDPANNRRISYSSSCPVDSRGTPVSGGVSNESLPGGTDGYAEYTVTQRKESAFGLSTSSPDNTWQTIDFGIKFKGTGVTDIIESGVAVQRIASSGVGTVFRIERKGASILYYQNGVLKRTRTIGSAISGAPLFVDVALVAATSLAEITDVRLVEDAVPTGNYYIGAIADPLDAVVEVDETNNAAVNGGGAAPGQTAVAVVGSPSVAASSSGGGGWGPWPAFVLFLRLLLRSGRGAGGRLSTRRLPA